MKSCLKQFTQELFIVLNQCSILLLIWNGRSHWWVPDLHSDSTNERRSFSSREWRPFQQKHFRPATCFNSILFPLLPLPLLQRLFVARFSPNSPFLSGSLRAVCEDFLSLPNIYLIRFLWSGMDWNRISSSTFDLTLKFGVFLTKFTNHSLGGTLIDHGLNELQYYVKGYPIKPGSWSI